MSLFGNNGIRTNASNIGTNNTTKSTAASSTSASSGISSSGLKPGDTIKGEIVDLGNNRATIRTSDNKTFSAKLDSNSSFDLNIGQKAEFEVVNASPTSLALKVRTENYMPMQDMAMQKALEEAGLPRNTKNMEIVRELLNHNLSIDKQMITKLLQQSYLNKDVSISTLALMNKHGIPTTEANVAQFEKYLNQEHQILGEINDITDQLPSLLANANNSEDILNLHNGLTTLAAQSDTQEAPPTVNLTEANKQELLQLLKENNLLTPDLESSILNGKADIKEIGQLLQNLFPKESEVGNSAQLSDPKNALTNPSVQNETIEQLTQQKISSPSEEAASPLSSEIHNTTSKQIDSPLIQDLLKQYDSAQLNSKELNQYLNAEDRQNLANLLKDFPLTKEQLDSIQTGTMKSSDLLKLVQQGLEQGTGEHTSSLLSSKEYQSVLTKTLLESWTLTPEQLSQDKQVNDLYNRIQKQLTDLDQLIQNMKQTTDTNASLSGTTKNLKDNIEFMNQLNQLFPYVQLPIKFRDHTLHSELFVYTKNKNLKSQTGEISVLLHLDLEHLKSIDIHVTLVNKQVSTKFYLEDKDSTDLIASNLQTLENALNEKGYLFTSEITQRKKDANVVEEFLEKDNSSSSLKRFSFDIRA